MSGALLVLVEAIVRTDAAGTLVTLRMATGAFTTGPAETPANTPYKACIKQPLDVVRDLFAGLATMGAARVGFGDLVLYNQDADLDAWMDYGWDGGPITVWLQTDPSSTAYPGGFTKVFVGTAEQPLSDMDTITIKLRDRILETQVPLQTTLYAGSGGLEGGAELKAKPKPVCLGDVFNVTPPLVDPAKLIFQVNDGAVASIDVVRDSGIPLGADLFLAVNQGGSAYSSPDGVVWSELSALSGYYSVAFGAGLFVAGDGAGGLVTSPDGVTWTSRTSHLTGVVWGLIWSGSLFIAADSNGLLSSSPDGITWTARTSGFAGTSINDVTYGGGVYVAVGSSGKLSSSPDGLTWTIRTSGFGATTVVGVGFGNGVFVAVGLGGTLTTSTDGTTWTARTSGFGSDNIFDVAYGNGFYVAVGQAGKIATSPDSTTWTLLSSTPLGTTSTLSSIVYANSLFVIGANGALPALATSIDGFVWVPLSIAGLAAPGIESITFASGIALGTYANSTDLLDDSLAPQPGLYKAYMAGGYFRLGASPAGLITADVTQGAAAADRKPGTVGTVLLTRAGKSAPDWSAADVTAMDALGYIVGAWYGPEDSPTVANVLDFLAASTGAWWGLDKSGIYRHKQLIVPAGTAVLALTENDIKKKPVRLATSDAGHGLPVWRVTLKHSKNWTVQTNGVAFGVSDADRALLALEWQTAKYDTASVRTKHLLSPEITIGTMLTSAANALTEATRIQTLRGVRRDAYELVVELNSETQAIDLGSVIDWTYSPNGTTRYGISGPKKMLVLGVQPNAARREVTLTVWG